MSTGIWDQQLGGSLQPPRCSISCLWAQLSFLSACWLAASARQQEGTGWSQRTAALPEARVLQEGGAGGGQDFVFVSFLKRNCIFTVVLRMETSPKCVVWGNIHCFRNAIKEKSSFGENSHHMAPWNLKYVFHTFLIIDIFSYNQTIKIKQKPSNRSFL